MAVEGLIGVAEVCRGREIQPVRDFLQAELFHADEPLCLAHLSKARSRHVEWRVVRKHCRGGACEGRCRAGLLRVAKERSLIPCLSFHARLSAVALSPKLPKLRHEIWKFTIFVPKIVMWNLGTKYLSLLFSCPHARFCHPCRPPFLEERDACPVLVLPHVLDFE